MRQRRPAEPDPDPGAGPAPALLRLVMSIVADNRPDLTAYADAERLSGRESRVLQGLAAGQSPAALAVALGVTPGTVRRHIHALRRKTGYGSVAALMMALGRLPPVPWPPAPQR